MTSRRLQSSVAISALALGASACFGNVSLGGPGDASDDAGPTATQTLHDGGPAQTQVQTMTSDDADAGTDSGPPVKTPPSSSEAGADASPGTTTGTATTVFIDSTNGFHDGAVATDGTTLFWVQESLTDGGGDQLVSCPATGCPSSGPSVFWTQANWGDGLGELVLQNGLLYFQPDMNGPILDCPTSGCGAGPNVFASVSSTPGFSAALASDGTNLYWIDNDTIRACSLGASCSDSTLVASLASGVYVSTIVPSGANLYWVASSGSGSSATLESAPSAGGPVSTVCSVAENQDIDTVAVIGDYAYLTPGDGNKGNTTGIYRCPLSGGAATLYFTDPGPFNITSDGTTLYWLSYPENDDVTLKSCAPGVTCESPTALFEVLYTIGFTISGSDVYSVSGKIRRTTL